MFKVSIPPITVQDAKHNATSWQVSNNGRFTDDDIIVNVEKDKDNLYEYLFDLPITNETIYYVRTKLHFDDDTETNWSKAVVVSKGIDGFSVNNTIIVTPKLELDVSPNEVPLGGFHVTADNFMLYTGIGKHKSTDWVIEDIFGKKVWSREDDTYNLTKIRIPSNVLNYNSTYVLKVRYKSDTNAYSNWGKIILTTIPEPKKDNNVLCSEDPNEELTKIVASVVYSTLFNAANKE